MRLFVASSQAAALAEHVPLGVMPMVIRLYVQDLQGVS